MKKACITAMVVALLCSVALAQGFEKGKFTIGPTISYFAMGSLGFGATCEYGVSNHFGIGGNLYYTSWQSDKYYDWYWSGPNFVSEQYWYEYSLLGGAATFGYHFRPIKKFDPWLKASIGYWNITASVKWETSEIAGATLSQSAMGSTVGYEGMIGMHYWFTPKMALRTALGFPYYLTAGLDFKL
jgi:opacity protein-like surface antigen